MKRCSKCGEEKDRSEFGPRKGAPDGLRGECRDCRRSPGMRCSVCGERKVFDHFYPAREGGYLPECRKCRGKPTDPRLCSECSEWKPLSEFPARDDRGDGYARACSLCSFTPADPDVPRVCSVCGVAKPLTEYFARGDSPDGYRRDCQECCAVRNTKVVRAWREENREKYLEQNRESVERWRVKYPERAEEVRLRDYAKHRDRYYANNRKRRARVRDVAVFEISAKDLRRIMSTACAHCGEPSEQLDHIIPLARGGSHSVGNLQGLCQRCNARKKDRLEVEVRYGRRRPRRLETDE